MNKSKLVAAMSEKSGLPKKTCQESLDALTAVIEDALKNGGKVKLPGFGTFEVKERAARLGRNPRTREPVDIPASRKPAFRPGQALKEAVS